MAEINIANLPIIPSAEFTTNDHLLIINDGKAQLLPRPTLETWINTVSKGEKGDQGVAGRDGRDGKDGTNGISTTHRWSGTTLTVTSASGTSSADLKGATGANGLNGTNGTNGWSPLYAVVARGDDLVLRISGWTGGTGTQPAIGQYLGSSGLVNDINQAVNIRGTKGDQGEQGIQGETGTAGKDGSDGTGITSIEYLEDGSVQINKSDSTSVQTGSPPNLTGWQSYKDTQYTQATPFPLSAQVETVIPNNAEVVLGNLPINTTAFYTPTNQKMNLQDEGGLYSVKIRFKVATPTEANDIRVTFSKDTTENPFVQDIVIPVSANPRNINVNTTIYGDSVLVSNGMSVRLFADKATSIYDVEFVIAKII